MDNESLMLSTSFEKAKYSLAAFALNFVTVSLRILPLKVLDHFSYGISAVLWSTNKRRRAITLKNLRSILALSDESSIRVGKRSFYSNILVIIESICMHRLLRRSYKSTRMDVSDEAQRLIHKCQSGEIPLTIAISSHYGVWEYVGAWLASVVSPTKTIVASKLPKNRVVADHLKNIRTEYGLHLFDKKEVTREVLNAHKGSLPPHLCMLLCDQHEGNGLKVPFLGKKCCTTNVPARLIHKYKLPALIGIARREKLGSYYISIDVLPLSGLELLYDSEAYKEITLRINTILSSYIREAPSQWIWMHRRWRECCGED
ncbi:lysophospholipid acyltransferase family protein [Bythopirellula goksoeyrii]|uniref:Lipid A biosynthesis lauroyl acyltransferase n=1 Tax=Bythopirellula goksoeyrii TaxID=1400387 RepID=A0A5B9QG00_9BACT|nr:lysophospholipid acyltransferase family protein [Bythopirellula goksoeyrii]QEG35856.1 lipid A biosynthesis lauroyl acyltransferase [Bythopirellula goksoeyrii]